MRPALLAQPVEAGQGTCPQMQRLIEGLAAKYQVNLSSEGIRLVLALTGSSDRLLISGLSGQRISVTHCMADTEEYLSCDTDLVFLVNEGGWIPIELLHTEVVWAAYLQGLAATGGVQVCDEAGEICLTHFAESWANTLEEQRWLDKSQRLRV